MTCLVGALIGTSIILIGTALSSIAVAVPYWTLVKNTYTLEENVVQGLFEICYKDICIKLDSLKTVSLPAELMICRVTNITGIALGCLACLASLHWLIKTRISSDKNICLPYFVFSASFLAAVLVTVTLAIYGVQLYHPAREHARLGYAFYLNVVAAFLLLVGGIVQRIAAVRYDMTSYPELPSEQQMFADPSGPLYFYNLQQEEDEACYRGLVYQKPQATVIEPPMPYTDYTHKEHTYVAHLKQDVPEEQYVAHLQQDVPEEQYVAHLNRDLPEGQYTPGETRKAAPGASSI